MSSFKRNSKSKKVDEIMNNPKRVGRKIISSDLSPSGMSGRTLTGRRVDSFSREEGFHLAQPHMPTKLGTEFSRHKALGDQDLLNAPKSSEGYETPALTPMPAVKKRRNWHRLRKNFYRGLVTIGIAFAAIGIFLGSEAVLNLHKVFGGNSNIRASLAPSALHVEGDGRINILLLGVGGEGHDGPDLTDTMLLVSIDPINHSAGLLSVPRDLLVKPNGYSPMKINGVYEQGKWKYLGQQSSSNDNHQAVFAGFNLANQTVSSVLGVPIQNDILLNFQAFDQIVNTLGGVSVNVTTELYDPTLASSNSNNPVIAKTGEQTFNGLQALLYVRSRETSSDFARSNRQRQVLVAIKQKLLSAGILSNPVKLTQLSNEIGNNVVTNMGSGDATTLYGILNKIDNSQINSIGLADPPNNYVTTTSLNGQSYVIPRDGTYKYGSIQSYVRNTLRDSYLVKENAPVLVVNGSSNPNGASNYLKLLKSYGYNASLYSGSTSSSPKSYLVDLTQGKNPYTQHYLELRLKTKASRTLPDSSITTAGASFVIIVGDDEANSS